MSRQEEIKKEIEECKECCYVRDMTNIKPALCNYHQGKLQGIQSQKSQDKKIVLDIVKSHIFNIYPISCDAICKEIEKELK